MAAVRALARVDTGVELDHALDLEIRAQAPMERRDRALATAIAYAAVRHRARIDAALERAAGRLMEKIARPLQPILRAAAAQMLVLDAVPDHAAVSTATEVARELNARSSREQRDRIAGFVNGVLRGLGRLPEDSRRAHPPDDLDPARILATELSYPRWLLDRWIARFGARAAAALASRWNEPAWLALRLAPGADLARLIERFREAGFEEAAESTWIPRCIRVRAAHPTELPGWDEGWFRVQDEASQAVVWLLDPKPGERILDLCAGMGTKTAAIAERAGGELALVAADSAGNRLRAQRAERRRTESREPNFVVLDGSRELPFRPDTFDRVLVDAPCTGLGVIRRHPEIKWWRSPRDVERSALLQRAILDRAAAAVRPGGVLVYATCSTEPDENEDVVRGALERHPDLHVENARAWLPEPFAPLVGDDGFLRTYPAGEGLDGFFAVRLRRESG